MSLIYETRDFTVAAAGHPLHSRENGGHIIIRPKRHFPDHFDLPLDIAAKYMHLSMLVGEAATIALRKRGLDVVRINYQEMGNWAYKPEWTSQPNVHLHMFIRTMHESHPDDDPRFQAFPEALTLPPMGEYYAKFQPLSEEDCAAIKIEIDELLRGKYRQAGLAGQ